MSLAHAILDKVKLALQKLCQKENLKFEESEEISEEIEAIFDEVESIEGGSKIEGLMQKMEESEEDENMLFILNEFKSMEPINKEIIVNLLHIVVKMGKIEDASDLEKRERWYNRINDAFNG